MLHTLLLKFTLSKLPKSNKITGISSNRIERILFCRGNKNLSHFFSSCCRPALQLAFIEQKICVSFDQESLPWGQVSEHKGNIFALQLIPPVLASVNFLTVLEILTTLFTLSFCIMSLRKFLQHDCTCPQDYPIIHIYQSYVFAC